MKSKRYKFPMATQKHPYVPHKGPCPMCRKNKLGGSMAILNGGAMLVTNRETGSKCMSDDLDGMLSLIWHGAHNEESGVDANIFSTLDIAEECPGGQFEFSFCSTDCLRAFFNACVDQLESQIAKKRKNKTAQKLI